MVHVGMRPEDIARIEKPFLVAVQIIVGDKFFQIL